MNNKPIIAIFVIGVLLFGAGNFALANLNHQVRTVTVTEKERVCDTSNRCQYLIFTDQTTLSNVDSLWHGKFNSSDVYGQIKVGEQYRLTTVGFRFGPLSTYPNIVDVEQVSTPQEVN